MMHPLRQRQPASQQTATSVAPADTPRTPIRDLRPAYRISVGSVDAENG
jgi:hypothetical protein